MSVFFDVHEFTTTIDVLEGDQVSPSSLISETNSLAELPIAFEALRQRTTQCKVLINPSLEAAP